jgi:hypothetical protein
MNKEDCKHEWRYRKYPGCIQGDGTTLYFKRRICFKCGKHEIE